MILKRISVFVCLGIVTAGTIAAQSAAADPVPVGAFAQVTPFLYRGARPTPEGLQALAAMHIKTDLNIEDDSQAVAAEEVTAKQLGMQYISIPLSGFFAPSDADMARIFKVIHEPSNYPIFLHCKHGEDRTGLVVGLYRYNDEHWTAQDAYSEMLAHGFHPLLLGLNHYFKEKTGLKFAEELQ
jgi:protein tyrosine/serine phosphatase